MVACSEVINAEEMDGSEEKPVACLRSEIQITLKKSE